MNLYKIRNWNEWFENNRSRTVQDLAWVAIPNRHDGENYTAIITSKDGAEIFSAWVLMVQVASRCQPRGSLLRDSGKPHDSASLSVKTRAPKAWFDKAIKFLSEGTDWLEITDVAVACQEADRKVSAPCQAPDEERRKGIEQKEASAAPPTSEHVAFIDGWVQNFKARFGSDYQVDGGRDGKAVRDLLRMGILRIDLLEIAKKAWLRGSQPPKAFNCEQASTIHGFKNYFNQIQVELKNGNTTHQRVNQRLIGVSQNNAVNNYAEAAKRKLERQMAQAENQQPPQASGNGA